MYKDKDKQRQAVKLATRRYRQKVSRVSQDEDEVVIPSRDTHVTPIESRVEEVKKQSHNPMMVGYVPPRTS